MFDVLFTLNMDKLIQLGSIFLLSFVNLFVMQPCQSRLTVDMEVSGEFVVRTGIRAYEVKTNIWNDNVRITCSSQVSVPATISLLNKYGELIKNGVTNENGVTVAILRVQNPDERYRCRLYISTWVSSDSNSEFVVSSEVEITTVSSDTSLFCGSSIGNTGYLGESVTLTCKVSSSYYHNCFYWENTDKKVLETVVTEDFQEQSCRSTCYWYRQTCPLSISALQTIHLNASVIVNGTQSNTGSVMEFLCTSTPPRLIYWKVFGTHGNLLDFDNVGQHSNVNTTVNITQSPGKTYLRIWEAVPGGNGIYTVMCSTYNTEKRVVAFAPITTPSESSCDFGNGNLKTTDTQETTSDNPTTTDESNTLAITTTKVVGQYDGFEGQLSTEQGHVVKKWAINNYLLIGFVSLPYILIILILISSIWYMHSRHKNKMEVIAAVDSQQSSPGTVLHDNPVYMSYSETKECSPNDEHDERAYANL